MSKKIFNISVLAILVIGFIVGSYLWKDLNQRPEFSSVEAKKGDVSESISISGKIAPVNSADLGFENGGKIVRLVHQVGDQVKAGDLLAESDSQDIQAQLSQAVAQRNSAQALLNQDKELVNKEQYKLKSLKGSDSANSNDKKSQQQQVDAQKYVVDSQEAQIAASAANINYLQTQLAMTKVYAPFDGVISKSDAEVGEVKQSNVPFMTLISDNHFQIEAYVSELDVKNIQVGDEATITVGDGEEKTFSAKVAQIYPAEEDINNISNYKVVFDVANNSIDLKSGMTANVTIATQKKSNVLLVPQKAVFEEAGHKYVYVTDGMTREEKEIQTGIYGNDGMVEIVSGLNQGDNILILNNK